MRARLVLPVFVLLAGCAALRPDAGEAVAVSDLIAEIVRVERGSEAEKSAAILHAQEAFAAEAGDLNRLRLAALLATLAEPLRDDARAGDLLAPLAAPRATDTPIGRFAALLAAQLGDRHRLITERERTVRAAGRREDVLKRRLEALKSIEQDIFEREERMRRSTR